MVYSFSLDSQSPSVLKTAGIKSSTKTREKEIRPTVKKGDFLTIISASYVTVHTLVPHPLNTPFEDDSHCHNTSLTRPHVEIGTVGLLESYRKE